MGNVSLALLLLFLLWCYVVVAEAMSGRPGYGDFGTFYASARELTLGGDIYARIPVAQYLNEDTVPSGTPEFNNPNLNPPFQTLILAPLGLLDYRPAFMVWACLGLFCGVAGATLLGIVGAEKGGRARSSLALTILLLAYFPTGMSFEFGQWALLPLLPMILAWVAWRNDQMGLAGAVLGCLAAIKLFFGAFFLLFLSRRSWRASLAFGSSWILCTVVSTAVVGFDSVQRYVSTVMGAHWVSSSWNGSFLGFFSRVFGGGENVPLLDAPFMTSFLSLAFASCAVGSLFLLRKPDLRVSRGEVASDLPFAVAIPVMLLVSPFGWMYYFPFLLLPLAVLWRASALLKARRTLRALLALAWLLSAVPNSPIRPRQIAGDPATVLLRAGVYSYTLLLFWGLAWGMQRALSGKPAPD